MNQNLHSPTKLTEFARDFEEEPDSLLGRFVNKIQSAYNHSYNTVNDIGGGGSGGSNVQGKSVFYADARSTEASPENADAPNPSQQQTLPGHSVSTESSTTSSSTTPEESRDSSIGKVEPAEGRTMVNVLKRISTLHIVAARNNDLRNYRDTDLQRFWMPDSKAKECYDCSQKFTTFRRKHHCRLCGQIFCSKCCNQVVPGKIIMCSGDLKVCNYCSKIVLSYLKSPNITVDLHSDLQALQQDLTNKLEEMGSDRKSSALPIRGSGQRKVSVGYQEERFATHQTHSLSFDDRKNILQQSNSLITLHGEMQRQLPSQNCGTDLIEFLNNNHKSSNKAQALAILNAMLAAGFLQPIVLDSEQSDFDETLHYKFVNLPSRQALDTLGLCDCAALLETPTPREPQPPKSLDPSASFQSALDIELENSATSQLLESYCNYEEQLLLQMLRNFQLDIRWAKVLTPLCCRAANHFRPEYCTNELMDIRNYVNFKKVPGGKRQDCTIVGGVVFSKNVAHKDMATRVERPRLLLLQCPIVYERIEGKFVSISTVLLQEKEYLRNVCARIMSFQPNVVLVHKNVAGVAQDMLRSHGITLVVDVKLSVMERLARTLQCDIVASIESNIAQPKLGFCDAFYIQSCSDANGSAKTLMYFEKLTGPRGYTCLLRGGSHKELTRVKKVASFLVYARYNWRLEMSFLLDEYAQSLSPKPSLFDSKEQTPEEENTHQEEPVLRSVPVQTPKRKSEERVLAAVSQNVADFTDPLRSTAPNANDTPTEMKFAVESRYDNRFRNALSSTLLSVSPFQTFPLPYLETEQGRKCALRQFFPTELYFSKLWSHAITAVERNESTESSKNVSKTQLNPAHKFLRLKITKPIDNREVQTLLAEFRALGARYPKKKKMGFFRNTYQRPQKISEDQVYRDALDLENHQRLSVLFCSFYFNPKPASTFCTPPTLLDMKFYGQQDIMLGQFLQRYCCHLSSICTLCNLPMLGHVRRYVHSMGCVQVLLSEDYTKTDPQIIYFTAWCSVCREVTPTVPLSETSKCLSLAKYLEMRFHSHAYKKRCFDDPTEKGKGIEVARCSHSLHRDYVHYFSYRGVGVKFQYTQIEVWEIGLPSLVLRLQPPQHFDHFQVLEEIKNFSMKGHEVYTLIHERIADLATEDESSPLVAELKTTQSKDQFVFKQHIEILQTLLTETKASHYDFNDAMLMAKRVLARSIELWIPRLHDIGIAQKLAAKNQQQQLQLTSECPPQVDSGTICTEDLRSEHLDVLPTTLDAPRLSAAPSGDSVSQGEDQSNDDIDLPPSIGGTFSLSEKKNFSDQLPAASLSVSSDKKSIKKMFIHLLPSAGHASLLQSPFPAHAHHTLPLGAFPVAVFDQDPSSIIAYSLTSTDYDRWVATMGSASSRQPENTHSSGGGSTEPLSSASPSVRRKFQECAHDSDELNKETSTKSSGSYTVNPSAGSNEDDRTKSKAASSHMDLSFQDTSTLFTCRIYFATEFDRMRAKTLEPPAMDNSLYKSLEQSKKREELKVSQSRSGPEMELVRKASDPGQLPTLSGGKVQLHANNETKDEGDELQTRIDECRRFLARSLCISVQWEARGGKSGSRFCKTLDDRFVLKEMTKGDVSLFESFAPNYFEYIERCQQQNQPTLLAKIFGVFRVTVKKKDFYQEKSLLVMENLFYGCDIQNKFDLKGSERNRHVDPTSQNGEIVLLDENLMQMSWSKPLYILSHSKAVLRDAINRDASFLEKNQVMDYSLLVGLDNNNSTLVLGIIDYIRTFTFDKRVESFVKQTGILGGSGKLPTVISPERYKQRFIDAMDRYFYTVPDRWEGLSKI